MRKKQGKNKFVLDTSGIFCLRDNEDGADVVEKILEGARRGKWDVHVSFVSLVEFYYIIYRQRGKKEAQLSYLELKMLPLKTVDNDEDLGLLAGEIKASYHLSLADCWIAATAVQTGGTLVHKDPEFEYLQDLVPLKTLPYKR